MEIKTMMMKRNRKMAAVPTDISIPLKKGLPSA